MTNYSNTTIIEKTIKTGVNKHENVRRCLHYLHFHVHLMLVVMTVYKQIKFPHDGVLEV